MKRNFLIAFLSVFLIINLFPQNSNSQPKKLSLDINTAVSLALANNLDIKSEKLKFDNAKWNAFTSWNTFVPRITMSATLAQSYVDDYLRVKFDPTATTIGPIPNMLPEAISIHTTETKAAWDLSAVLNLSLDINAVMVFKVYQSILDYQSGKVNLEIAKSNVINNVKKNFYTLILIQNQINIIKENIDIQYKRYNEASVNFKNGLKTEFDLLSAEVDYEDSKLDLDNKVNEYSDSLLQFKQLLGLKDDVELEFNANIESEKKDFDSKELIAKYLDNSLTLKSSKLSIDSAGNARNNAISALTPTFSIGLLLDPDFQQDPRYNKWFGDYAYMNDNNWKYQRANFSMTVSLPISSLFPFGAEQMNIVRSQYNIETLKISSQKTRENLEIQIKKLVKDLRKNINTINTYKQNLALAKRAFDMAEESYKVGTMKLLDVQVQENKLENAKFNLLNAEYSYTSSLLDLENVLNTKLHNDN